VGGKQIEFQALGLQKGADVLVGTPGRIKELMEKKYLSFERCSWVVIDEADKMIS
jgi:ATP-dependent RNA helicase DDX23/PRP28